MKGTYKVIIAIAIVSALCIAGGVVLLNHQDRHTVGYYSYGYEMIEGTGNLITDSGGQTINLDEIDDCSYLITLWNGDVHDHYDHTVGYQWLRYIVDFKCTPGMKINSKDIHIMEEYLPDDDRYTTPYIEQDGAIYHHEDSDVEITLGLDGSGRIIMIILSSECNPRIPIIAVDGVDWKLDE